MYFEKFLENLTDAIRQSWLSFARTLPSIFLAILIIAIGIFIARKLAQISRRITARKTDDIITVNFISSTIKLVLSLFVIMYGLKVAGLEAIATGLFAAAGASAVIIGFAFRDIGENFIAGIILSFNRPFNVNDSVQIGEVFGKIKNITFRYTKVKTFDGKDVYIPNSDVLTKPVFNFTEDGYFRFDFVVGIAYEDDVEAAEQTILQVLNDTADVHHDEHHINFVIAEALDVSTVNLKVHFWVNTFEYGREALIIKGRVISYVKKALLAGGYNLPADIKELKLYGTQTNIPVSMVNDAAG